MEEQKKNESRKFILIKSLIGGLIIFGVLHFLLDYGKAISIFIGMMIIPIYYHISLYTNKHSFSLEGED